MLYEVKMCLDELKIGMYYASYPHDAARMRGAPTFSLHAYANGTTIAPVVRSTNLV